MAVAVDQTWPYLQSDDRTAAAVELASRAQALRRSTRKTGPILVTRSTLLWALIHTDEGVRTAMAAGGVAGAEWSRELTITSEDADELLRSTGSRVPADEIELDIDLVKAIELFARPGSGLEPSPTVVATALLRSTKTGRSQVLPRRLKNLGFDTEEALEALSAASSLLSSDPSPSDPSPEPVPVSLDMLADIPIDDPNQDLMNFGPYVNALAQLLQASKTKTPLTMAINGPWGSGKTSLGRMVTTRLTSDNRNVGRIRWWLRQQKLRQDKKPIVIWFNAWLHDDAENLGAALTANIARKLARERPIWWRLLRPLPLSMLPRRRRIWYRVLPVVAAFILALLVASVWRRTGWWGLTEAIGLIQSITGDDTTHASDSGELGTAAEVGTSALLFTLISFLPRLLGPARAAAAFISSPQSEAQGGGLEAARTEIGKLIREARRGSRKVVIFVDDLERCNPPKAVEICEVSNQLLSREGVFTIYLADMAKIASNVEIKYRDYALSRLGSAILAAPPVDVSAGPAGTNTDSDSDQCIGRFTRNGVCAHQSTNGSARWGRAYMEKMVQIQIDVPRLRATDGLASLAVLEEETNTDGSPNRLQQIMTEVRSVGRGWFDQLRYDSPLSRWWQKRRNGLAESSSDLEPGHGDSETGESDPRMRRHNNDEPETESRWYREAEPIVADHMPPNPRAAKRFANRLRFEVAVAEGLGKFDGGSDPYDMAKLVGKWTVLVTRWPDLVERLQADADLLSQMEHATDNELADLLGRLDVMNGDRQSMSRLLRSSPPFGDHAERFLYHFLR